MPGSPLSHYHEALNHFWISSGTIFTQNKKNREAHSYTVSSGATGRTRTADLLITNQLLYQLSHSSEYSVFTPIASEKRSANHSFYIIIRTFCFCKPFLQNL